MKKKQSLFTRILNLLSEQPKGKILDLGCGAGHYAIELHKMGFDVIAADVTTRFEHKDKIQFAQLDETKPLPFSDNTFDYVLFAEVVEHLRDPYRIIADINRVLKKGGSLVLSTPNILNMKSRMRYFFEGSYEYFREPPVEHFEHNVKIGIDTSQVHVVPYRYHELEFLLKETGYEISQIATSIYEGKAYSFLVPIMKFHAKLKEKRSLKKGGIDYSRINRILLTPEMLFGRHLIVRATKL